MSNPNFINHEIVFNPTGNEFDECRSELLGSYQLVKIEDYEYKFIKQPQLMIPKSIADILDNVFNSFTELQNNANSLMIQTIYTHYEPETIFYKWFNKEDNSYNISIIYLAGKALGVDLVKVVEND